MPVTHEEISIERRAPSDREGQVASEGPVTSTEEINIPLKKEEVEVTKTPYDKGQVPILNKPIKETRKLKDITSERIITDS